LRFVYRGYLGLAFLFNPLYSLFRKYIEVIL
jgi:hypothetical protein